VKVVVGSSSKSIQERESLGKIRHERTNTNEVVTFPLQGRKKKKTRKKKGRKNRRLWTIASGHFRARLLFHERPLGAAQGKRPADQRGKWGRTKRPWCP
jgi:hypothetical protein